MTTGAAIGTIRQSESSGGADALFSREKFIERYHEPEVLWSFDVGCPPHPEYWRINEWAETLLTNTYQWDRLVRDAWARFQEVFGADKSKDNLAVVFAPTGTAANRLLTTPFLNTGNGIVMSSIAHGVEREAGSIPAQTGSRVFIAGDTKLDPASLDAFLTERERNYWISQRPEIVSISNPTEVGTLYTIDEVRELVKVAHRHNLLFQLDGARLFLAAAKLGCSLKEITTDCGVDLLALGGAKCGMYKAEASVFLPPFFEKCGKKHFFRSGSECWHDIRSALKRVGGLQAQSAGAAAQFLFGLHDNFALQLGARTCRMAELLTAQLATVPYCKIALQTETNPVFLGVPSYAVEAIQSRFRDLKTIPTPASLPKDFKVVRFMTHWGTTTEQIEELASTLTAIVSAARENHEEGNRPIH